ncbi:hypothetical protein [Streptomyces sp. NPDC002133]|uniref:hypothetical protein n=1 Tax=Streptomyces sp. NPDC002133 TaxID=3154409 RepID=UPI0033335004
MIPVDDFQGNEEVPDRGSYDGAKTWHDAKVKGSGDKRTVTVKPPHHSSGGAVSLRTYAKDAAVTPSSRP